MALEKQIYESMIILMPDHMESKHTKITMKSMPPIHSYKDLIVWQKSTKLAVIMYELTSRFPKTEQFGLTSQMRRAAVSMASNIAEGRCRGTRKDFAQFLRIAFGSGAELETQIIIAKELGYLPKSEYQTADSLLTEIMKMLNTFIYKIHSIPST